ncbi:hemicentin-1-like [Myotis daubentonii]|uniref:hemicentin-1-like n=1 Tax=Myotis daubentonii TaxID=98922 RepID=UPI0028734BE1|nr:hemicentin-1-like [Myotis daubentonii]
MSHGHNALGSPCLSHLRRQQVSTIYQGSLISLYLCFQMLILVTGAFQVQGSHEPMVAMLGGEAELPCSLEPRQSIKYMKISWTRTLPSQVVHLYEDGRDKPEKAMEEYLGRTQLVKNVMHKGIVVLKILNVQTSDNGQYCCVIQHGSFYSEAVIELKVAALGSRPQFHVEVTKSRELRLECKSEGWFPRPKVQWMDSEGGEIPAQSETHTQDKGGLSYVTTSLLLREASQKNLTCSVWNPVLNQKKEEQFSIAGAFQVQGPHEPLVAILGGEAELPCFLLPPQNVKNMEIRWTRSLPSQVVHLYEDGRDKPEEAMVEYLGRTELVKNVMPKGIVVLKILNVQPSDNGQYCCAFKNGSFYNDTVIELKVAALGSHPQFHLEVTKSSQLRLECKSEGWFPQPKVQWTDSEGGEILAQSETHTQDKGGLSYVTTSLLLSEASQKNLTCSVWNPVLNQKKEEQFSIAGAFQVQGPHEPLVAMLGGVAELPCFLLPPQNVKNMEISWTRYLPSHLVHMYEEGRDKPQDAMKEYFKRTELERNVMHKGMVVLRIFNIQLSDSGQYRCAFQNGSFYSDTVIELKVAALGSHPQFHVEVTESSQLRLECKSEGWFPQPKVQWMDSEGREIPAETETHTQDKDGLFHVTTSLLLREASQKNLTCSVWNPVLNQKKEEHLSIAGAFRVQGPHEPMVAMLGGDAELPCLLLPHQSVKNMKISWTRFLPSQVVHLYEDGRDKPEEAHEEYFGRTELVTDYMDKGVVTLRILNVQPSDSGQYRCAFQHGSFYSDAIIMLKMAALGSHPQFHVEVTKSSQLRLECKSEGWFPQPKVQWTDSEGGEIPAEYETHTQDKGGLFHVTTSLLLREPPQKNLTCSIWNPVLNQKKEERLSTEVVEPISTTVNEPINTTVIPVVTSLAALLIMLIFIGLLYLLNNSLKNRSKNRSGKREYDTHHGTCQATRPVTRDYAAVPADQVEFYAECNPEGTSANAPGPAILAYYACVASTKPAQDGARTHAPGTAPASQEEHNTSPDQYGASADPPRTTLGKAAIGADSPKVTDADLDPEATCTYPPGTVSAAQEDHTTNPDQEGACADPPGAALPNATPKATNAHLDPEAAYTYPPGAAPAEAHDTLSSSASKAFANVRLFFKYNPKKKAELHGITERFTGLSIGPYLQKVSRELSCVNSQISCSSAQSPGSTTSMQSSHPLENLSNFNKNIVSHLEPLGAVPAQ